jgi:peptide/nickel transport system ATP-binding protein
VNDSTNILEIKNLRTYFYIKAGIVKAIDGIDLTLKKGTKLGLVGESGSGKTTMALSIMRMIRPPDTIEGQILVDGIDLLKLSEVEMRKARLSKIAIIPQGAMNSMNPVMRIKDQLVDGMTDHGVKMIRSERKKMVSDLLEMVELPSKVAELYPHELSGGMKQRVTVAISISLHPKLIIADEPTSALDVVTQHQVVEIITRLVHNLNMSMILIGHDMGLMAQSVDWLAVMYAGHLMEVGEIHDIFADPLHPYTQALIRSLPVLGKRGMFEGIPGIPPSLINPPSGCPFQVRCHKKIGKICEDITVPSQEIKPGHFVSCHLYSKVS